MLQPYHPEIRAVVITHKQSHKIKPIGTSSKTWAELLRSFPEIAGTCSHSPHPQGLRNPACPVKSSEILR